MIVKMTLAPIQGKHVSNSIVHNAKRKRKLTEISKHDKDIPPPMLELNIQRCEEFISYFVLTVAATLGSIWVIDVSFEYGDKVISVRKASFSSWRVESCEFVGVAGDIETVKFSGKHASKHTSVSTMVG